MKASFLDRKVLGTIILALLGLACSGSEEPEIPHTHFSPPAPDLRSELPDLSGSCQADFDPCECPIASYESEALRRRLAQPRETYTELLELATNLSEVAVAMRKEYFETRDREKAYLALRFYSAYLSLVPLSDEMAPYALLSSIAIYCDLDCNGAAMDLARELVRGYHFSATELERAFEYCH
ncbi:MAG TPA: hypothetical protein VF017_14745 [Thermoanaerobaculia bacterium]|nr:hypothetical protein [Thermoanaerobaculia bacterium]